MNDGAESGCKWTCNFCTYENFPATKKCTMCFKSRSSSLISDTLNEEQDIYKMAPLVKTPVVHEAKSSSTGGIVEGSKWVCEFCTYANWAKSTKCVQCLNPKRKSSPPTSSSQENLQNIFVSTSESPLIGCSAQKLSPNTNKTLVSKESFIDNKSSSNSIFHNPLKWICATCTYENWPRSQKCVICTTPRGPSSSVLPLSPSRSHDVIVSPQRHSPTSLYSARSQGDIGATASSAALTSSSNSPTSSHPSTPPAKREKRLLLLRSQLRDSDWLWLNACHGAVDGDMEAIHAFVAGGGHPSRQLTLQEVELLNRPSAFQVYFLFTNFLNSLLIFDNLRN